MPATTEALAAEGEYAAALRALTHRVARLLTRQMMLTLDPDNLAAALEVFVPAAAAQIAAGQAEAQVEAQRFVTAYLAAEGSSTAPVAVKSGIAGTSSTGRPLPVVLGGSLASGIFGMLRAGRPVNDAMLYGAKALARLAQGEIATAADREIANQGTQHDRVAGWLWGLTGGENCAACLSRADNRVRPFNEPMPRHGRCDCIRSVRLADDPGTVERPTGAEVFVSLTPERQAAQFHTAGEAKAELVRSGRATLADLSRVETHDGWRSTVVERPLIEVA